MKIVQGKAKDINQWMELIEKINHEFPGLKSEEEIEEHKKTVLAFMRSKEAYYIKDKEKMVAVVLFSKEYNIICCLGVAEEYRRHGAASALLTKAISKLDRTKDIIVSTFREGDENGIAPRALYKKFGFEEDRLIEEYGYPCQTLRLPPLRFK